MTAKAFRYEALPMRVRFGFGAASALGDELVSLGFSRAVLICTPQEAPLASSVAAALGDLAAAVLPEAVMHVPDGAVTAAGDQVAKLNPDVLVPVGGGSATGLAKALALETGLPIVAIPTTYAGSEMTPIWGRTSEGVKQTGRDPRVLPVAVIYDPELTLSLPAHMSGVSGLNAVAHAVEALYAPDATPIVTLMALEGVRLLARSLPLIVTHPADLDARSDALEGAWLCGACLGNVTMSLHHKLCHALGGAYDLPHADTHALVLPYVVAYNAAGAPAQMRRLAEALDGADAVESLWSLARTLGAPRSLADLGLRRDDIEHVVELAMAAPYANPMPVTADGVRATLMAALEGLNPACVAATSL